MLHDSPTSRILSSEMSMSIPMPASISTTSIESPDHDRVGGSESKPQPNLNLNSNPEVTTKSPLKHVRQRSSSWGATFYSSTIVPASRPLDSEALASLISSLTSISEAQNAILSKKRSLPKPVPSNAEGGDLISRIAQDPDFHRTFYDAVTPAVGLEPIGSTVNPPLSNSSVVDEDDREFCPPPVAGYNTINADRLPPRPKTAGAERTSRRFKKKSQRHLQAQSQATLRSARSSRDQQTPDPPATQSPPRLSNGNESVRSLPSSTNSKKSKGKIPLRMFFASGFGSGHSTHTADSLPSSSHRDEEPFPASPDRDRDRDMRMSAFVSPAPILIDFDRRDSEDRTLHSLSPSYRADFGENIIPSRRSSLRSARHQSRGSKDLKSLNIDQDLIEENHETVQRIRELHEAREKRHSEWRREARRSDKATKRSSISKSSASPVRPVGNPTSSWYAKPADQPGQEAPSDVSARGITSELSSMPNFGLSPNGEPLTPLDRPMNDSVDIGLHRKTSVNGSTTQSISSATKHRHRLSDTIKRASSLRRNAYDDTKAVNDEVDAFLSSPRFTQKIRHPRTGRTITFSEVGDPNGFAVICCVGMGLTRYITSFYDDLAKSQKLKIITPDRPGVGQSDPMPDERSTPLAWVDDVAVICSSLGIEKFSLLAHSAGAIYALATALKMPQYVRGRIHLLGPWIPPSQLAASEQDGITKAPNLPTAHKILTFLPVSFMKAANSRFLSATSASIEPRSRSEKRKNQLPDLDVTSESDYFQQEPSLSSADFTKSYDHMLPNLESTPQRQATDKEISCYQAENIRSPPMSPTSDAMQTANLSSTPSGMRSPLGSPTPTQFLTPQARRRLYNTALTHRIWSLATMNANPAVDLITCLERKRPIGFRYTDITRAVVIHHGSNDARVPLQNVRWLSTAMKRCELRVLENETHGLMASATVMANVLGEISKEWEDWSVVAKEMEKKRQEETAREEAMAKERERGFRRGYPRW